MKNLQILLGDKLLNSGKFELAVSLFTEMVQKNETLLKREEYIDMGNVDDISNGEFFGASIWALIKSFKSPFKTLMKMGILEDYMFTKTKSNLLCHQVKNILMSNMFQYRKWISQVILDL